MNWNEWECERDFSINKKSFSHLYSRWLLHLFSNVEEKQENKSMIALFWYLCDLNWFLVLWQIIKGCVHANSSSSIVKVKVMKFLCWMQQMFKTLNKV